MTYNSFYANILIRILLLVISIFGMVLLLYETNRFFSTILAGILIVGQTISLINYLNKTNKNLAHFLLLLTQEDTSVVLWKNKIEKTFRSLNHSFRRVNEEISRIRLEKEYSSILLENIIEQLQTGVIVADKSGSIEIVNSAALKIFERTYINHLKDLDQIQKDISETLFDIRNNVGKIIHFKKNRFETIPLLVKASHFMLGDKSLQLFAIQGIKSELEAQEIESWQQMTQVLAHEIANSVTPLTTLGSTIRKLVKNSPLTEKGTMSLNKSTAGDIMRSAELIESRGQGLIEFIEHYKRFSKLPDPEFKVVEIDKVFKNVEIFFHDTLEQENIQLNLHTDPINLALKADLKLLDQALINLIGNSIHALHGSDHKIIDLISYQKDGAIVIKITDSGPGIDPDIQSRIFIPFFTTKPKGTGVGLSIVKKIVLLHEGTILVDSVSGGGATFIMQFPVS